VQKSLRKRTRHSFSPDALQNDALNFGLKEGFWNGEKGLHYEKRMKGMPLRILKNHGVVVSDGQLS